MQAKFSLSYRQQHVLWATVRHYVATAEPVGSKALVDEYDLGVSPATIRNAMGSLEKSGLLYQPHTSAGRIPSDSGYRIYVDQLMRPADEISQRTDTLLTAQLDWDGWSLEALLRGAAHILATLSGYITLITLPQLNRVSIRHLQLIQVEPGQLLLMVLLDSYTTQSILVRLPQIGTRDGSSLEEDSESMERELQILSNFLTSQLRGRPLTDVAAIDWSELGREFQSYADTLRDAIAVLAQRSQTVGPSQIVISGLAEVLRQPEFSETHQVQTLVHLLEEEQEKLWPLLLEPADILSSGRNRVRVWIGAENPLEPMRACALVSSTYQRGTTPVGSIGVLGPTRMVYENAVAVVEAAADYLSEALTGEDR